MFLVWLNNSSLPNLPISSMYYACPAPTAQVCHVKVEWANSNRAATTSWTPLTLHQARGFPIYFVTYEALAPGGRVFHAVNTANSSVIIDELEPMLYYAISVDVGTAGGELRSTLSAG